MFGGSEKTELDAGVFYKSFFCNKYLVYSFSYFSRPIVGTCSLSNGCLYVIPYEMHKLFYGMDLAFHSHERMLKARLFHGYIVDSYHILPETSRYRYCHF